MRSPPARPRGQPSTSEAGKAAGNPRPIEDKALNAILEKAIRRLQDAVEQETAALQSRSTVNLNEFNHRKNQGLLELDRALRLLNGAPPSEAMKDALRLLRVKLDANREVLKTHIDAVRQVAAIIAEAIRGAESDGTYSLSFRSKDPTP
jgi:hypothetical protein